MKKRMISLVVTLCLLMSSASALTVEQAGELLETYYIDEIPEEVLSQPTIEEMLEALGDPYTAYYNEEEYAAFLSSMEDVELIGIGIRAYYLENGVYLTQIAPDSPADEVGLQPGDIIVAVDGHDTRGAADEDVEQWLHDEMGTRVQLTILRGEETFDVMVTRRHVVFPTVVLEKIENRIGWISCTSFGSTTFQHFYDIITAHDEEVDEWVIDLRGNGGGDVFAALFSVGCFAGDGSGAYLRDGDGTYYGYLFKPSLITKLGYYDGDLTDDFANGYLTMDPAHVLVDEHTASAAEFFSVAIRDSGAGLIIGGRTYGKGVAQTILDKDSEGLEEYFEENDALKITVERAFATEGATYDKVGVLPHFLVDSDLADEVAALLAAPITQEEDLLYLRNLSTTSQIVDSMAVPVTLLQDPANAEVVTQIFKALPATASCVLRENGELRKITVDEAAQLAGVTLAKSFSDVEESAYAAAIKTLGVYGIVSGAGGGSFHPEEALDRASLCAMLVKALRFPISDEREAIYSDVPDDSWYTPYVNALSEMGFIDGDEDGMFCPEKPVNHEEFLVILSRAAQWLDMNYYEMLQPDGLLGGLVPSEEELEELYGNYSPEVRNLVWLCDEDFAWADLTVIDPAEMTSREEAAAAVYNLLRVACVVPG